MMITVFVGLFFLKAVLGDGVCDCVSDQPGWCAIEDAHVEPGCDYPADLPWTRSDVSDEQLSTCFEQCNQDPECLSFHHRGSCQFCVEDGTAFRVHSGITLFKQVDVCDDAATDAPPDPTETALSAHYIVGADDGEPNECAADGATMGSTQGNAESANIAVQCCAMDGLSANRPGCVQGVTFEDAEDVCASEGMRLCTQDEVLTGMGTLDGCTKAHSTSDYHVWTSTPCPSADITAAPTPQTETCLYEDGQSCGTQIRNLGVHSSPESCANAAVGDDRCGDFFMFSENYWASWRCRCCSPAQTNLKSNQNWDLYTTDCALSTENSADSNVWIIDLRSFPSANAFVAPALLLILVLTAYVVYKRISATHNVYAKVQIHDSDVVSDEDQMLQKLEA